MLKVCLERKGVPTKFVRQIENTMIMKRTQAEWIWLYTHVDQITETAQVAHWRKYPGKYKAQLDELDGNIRTIS